MIVPYKGRKATSSENILFNERFSRARVVVEHVMGMLKCIFSSLKGIRNPLRCAEDLKFINEWIVSIMIIHNITLFTNDEWDEEALPIENNLCPTYNNDETSTGEIMRENLEIHLKQFYGD